MPTLPEAPGTRQSLPAFGLDNCPACGLRISDVDPGGCEPDEGQRYCLWHVPAEVWARNFPGVQQPTGPGFLVICEDRVQRHTEPFATRALAADWAEWGHACTRRHRIIEESR